MMAEPLSPEKTATTIGVLRVKRRKVNLGGSATNNMKLWMRRFRKNGFLSGALPAVPRRVRRIHRQLFRLCEDLNRVSHKMMLQLRVSAGNPLHLLAATTFLRILQGLQASYLLTRKGLNHDAAVALRSAFEALCLLQTCNKKPELAFDFVSADELEQLKLANANIARLRRKGDKDLLPLLEKEKDALDKRIKSAGTKQVSAFDLAQTAGLGDLYDTMWRLVSAHAHTSPRALDNFFSGRGTSFSVNYGPDYRGVDTHLSTIAEFSLMSQANVGQIFGVPAPKEHQELGAKFRQLMAAQGE